MLYIHNITKFLDFITFRGLYVMYVWYRELSPVCCNMLVNLYQVYCV